MAVGGKENVPRMGIPVDDTGREPSRDPIRVVLCLVATAAKIANQVGGPNA